MDPNATLSELVDAIREWNTTGETENLALIQEHSRNLREWLARGGFAPKFDTEQLQTVLFYLEFY